MPERVIVCHTLYLKPLGVIILIIHYSGINTRFVCWMIGVSIIHVYSYPCSHVGSDIRPTPIRIQDLVPRLELVFCYHWTIWCPILKKLSIWPPEHTWIPRIIRNLHFDCVWEHSNVYCAFLNFAHNTLISDFPIPEHTIHRFRVYTVPSVDPNATNPPLVVCTHKLETVPSLNKQLNVLGIK